MTSLLLDNLSKIRLRIEAAASRAGRDPAAVGLVVVTKYAPLEAVKEVLASGLVREVGENRVQDAQRKKEALGPLADSVRWRLIGHLQTNKARQALRNFSAIDSVDSLKLAAELDRVWTGEEPFPVLVQVKLSDKETQSGAAPEELEGLLSGMQKLPRLRVRGLMSLAPMLEPVEAVRPHFRRMRELFERFFAGKKDAQLSMGMSRDFEIAVEEGATLVRVGSAIFPVSGSTQ